jgi:peroxiredoxin Q/BCP
MMARASTVLTLALSLGLGLGVVGCDDKKKADPTGTGPVASATPSAAASMTTTTTAADVKLKEGDPAPDVELPLQDGRKVKLSSLKGQLVAVYFYPKDQTPGCTIEAQNFRDRSDDLKKAGITVIGVSTQDAASHKAFIEKEKLPFDLAVDEDKTIAKAFGVPSKFAGMHARWTFLVGKDGNIKKIWRDVTPKDHADEVLSAAKS